MYSFLDDPSTPDRCAVIQGTAEQIAKATQYISELVNKVCKKQMFVSHL